MGIEDEERLRARQADADDDATRRPGSDDDAALAVVCKTAAKVTYPTTAGRFFWVIPQSVTGAEAEGGAGTVGADGDGFYALHLGATIPPSGTAVVCVGVRYRFVFSYG